MLKAKPDVAAQSVPVNSELVARAERAENANASLGVHIAHLQNALRDGIRLMPLEKMGEWKTVTVPLLHKMDVFDRQSYKMAEPPKEAN